jgi:hypothetical protein
VVRIEAIPAKRPTRLIWWLSLVAAVFGMYRIRREDYPKVVAVNSRGERRLLFETLTYEEAKAKRDRVAGELAQMSLEDWCARYRLPADWL